MNAAVAPLSVTSLVWHDDRRVSMSEADYLRLRDLAATAAHVTADRDRLRDAIAGLLPLVGVWALR